MKIGLYILAAILFVVATAAGVYMLTPQSYKLSIDTLGLDLPSLPIAVWIAIPVALFAIFSILHMMFYGTKVYLKNKKWQSDAKKVEDTIYWSLIKEPTEINFANNELKRNISLLFNSTLNVKDYNLLDLTPKIKETLKVIKEIEDGKFVNLNSVKFAKHLSENNEIKIKNFKNRLNEDKDFAIEVIDFKDKYPKEIISLAYDKLVENKDFFTLKKYAKELGKERFFKLLNRVNKKNNLGFSSEILKGFIENYDFDCKDYLKLAQKLLEELNPEDNLKLFKELIQKDEDAIPAYLYILFRYELLDKVKDILDEHENHEYKAFRALLALKRNKHNLKVTDLINEENACK